MERRGEDGDTQRMHGGRGGHPEAKGGWEDTVPTQVPGHSPARIGSAGAGRANDDKRGARGGSTKWAASEHVGTRRGWEGRRQGATGVGRTGGESSSDRRHDARRSEVGEEEAYHGALALRGDERTLSPSARQAAALPLPGGRPMVETDRGRALSVEEVLA